MRNALPGFSGRASLQCVIGKQPFRLDDDLHANGRRAGRKQAGPVGRGRMPYDGEGGVLCRKRHSARVTGARAAVKPPFASLTLEV